MTSLAQWEKLRLALWGKPSTWIEKVELPSGGPTVEVLNLTAKDAVILKDKLEIVHPSQRFVFRKQYGELMETSVKNLTQKRGLLVFSQRP
jgi:hypothetical protein